MEQVSLIVCPFSQAYIRGGRDVALGELIILNARGWHRWKNARFHCIRHQIIWNRSLSQVVHIGKIWHSPWILRVNCKSVVAIVFVRSEHVVKGGTPCFWVRSVWQALIVVVRDLFRCVVGKVVKARELSRTFCCRGAHIVFCEGWSCHQIRLMMVYDRICKRSVLISNKL